MQTLYRVILLIAFLPCLGHAKPMLHDNGVPEPSHDILAAKIIGGASFDPHGVAHRRTGVAVLYEHPFIPHWLEGEVSVGAMLGDHATFLPVELLLKVPFALNKHWELFAGAGPAMMVDLDHGEAFFGGVVSAGTFVWLSEHFGLLFELDYLLLEEHGTCNEVEGAVGVAWRI